MSKILSMQLSDKSTKPIFTTTTPADKKIKCLLDTGADMPVWCGSEGLLKVVFPKSELINIDTPMVFGLIRPQIYLPISMESEDLSYVVIAHEKMHIKRKEGLFKMSAYAVCLIHWFNPFIWMAYFLFGSDMEKACDEEVIGTMSREKRKEYAYAL